jgi:hypothetical protein
MLCSLGIFGEHPIGDCRAAEITIVEADFGCGSLVMALARSSRQVGLQPHRVAFELLKGSE